MQKFLSTVFFLSFILGIGLKANAQSIEITYVSDTIKAAKFDDAVAKIYIKNVGEGTVDVLVERKVAEIKEGQQSYFCWAENCYGPKTIVSPSSTNMESGDSTDYFKGYLAANGELGLSRVKYCFYDTANNADSACAWVTYEVSEFGDPSTGVKQVRIIPYGLNIYPNPMTTIGNIAFDLPSETFVSVKVFNILGGLVQQENLGMLPAGAYKEKLDTGSLTKGIYLIKVNFNNMELIRKITVK